ncbi:hypothetical protein [Desulfovibrio ferrophilus]|uniref:Uncharacterized protein n=1 Tax=Desulfovibrio ferrophilus TaxID=241368 RepID=A0A2Z6B300_9BACT|nr:hypothetical protein [Desulfovibrio ferrophilus]BBD09790.1 uncharacterized protein DFE_3064 [Desulfovibrio ferrophilus]
MARRTTLPSLTPEQEEMKRYMYEKLSPRRRKFIDKVGYENWDPFPEPNDPMDIRQDEATGQTIQDLVRTFIRSKSMAGKVGAQYSRGAHELAMGIVNKDERFRGMFEFIVFYNDLLRAQGKEMDWDF